MVPAVRQSVAPEEYAQRDAAAVQNPMKLSRAPNDRHPPHISTHSLFLSYFQNIKAIVRCGRPILIYFAV